MLIQTIFKPGFSSQIPQYKVCPESLATLSNTPLVQVQNEDILLTLRAVISVGWTERPQSSVIHFIL